MARSFALLLMIAWLVPALTGCVNPNIVNSVSGSLYPTAPGDTRFLLVRVVNDTEATLDVPIAFDDGTNATPYMISKLTPQGREAGVLLDWPILRVGIGNLDNPLLATIIARFSDGTSLALPPQVPSLTAGSDYNQGDTIIYQLTSDARTPAAITVAIGRIDGSTQEGPFTRADTFETVQLLLELNNQIGGAPVQ